MAASQRLRQVGQTAMALQQHLSQRGPGTAESAPLRPNAGIQAAIRVVKAGAQSRTHRSKTIIPCDHMELFSRSVWPAMVDYGAAPFLRSNLSLRESTPAVSTEIEIFSSWGFAGEIVNSTTMLQPLCGEKSRPLELCKGSFITSVKFCVFKYHQPTTTKMETTQESKLRGMNKHVHHDRRSRLNSCRFLIVCSNVVSTHQAIIPGSELLPRLDCSCEPFIQSPAFVLGYR